MGDTLATKGIDAAHLDDIFLPFFTTRRIGSGICLSASRRIMALNKGMLALKTAAGVGCEFTRIDVASVDALRSEVSERHRAPPTFRLTIDFTADRRWL